MGRREARAEGVRGVARWEGHGRGCEGRGRVRGAWRGKGWRARKVALAASRGEKGALSWRQGTSEELEAMRT